MSVFDRVRRLLQAITPRGPAHMVLKYRDQTEADAFAAHEREHGPIPAGASVTIIEPSFRSRI